MHKCEGTKRCIFLQFVCDGENDCLNGSDESEESCLSEYTLCSQLCCDLGHSVGIVAVSIWLKRVGGWRVNYMNGHTLRMEN